ncbi:MAG TPA: SGNH/GDSL hydrolase family protein [Polyangiaceae bacterium]|nr:SGNH/GDSL hydrolase family protein [Polyangiaceae bacterium]
MKSPRGSRVAVAALVACSVGLISGGASAQNIVQTCSGLANVRVEWAKTPFFGSFAYSVKSLTAADGSTSTAGWRLHHRPVEGWPYNWLDPDRLVTGSAIIDYSIWQALMPVVPVPYFGTYQVTSLTSPDGECVFSPLSSGQRTYSAGGGPKVALVGDSLTVLNELCGVDGEVPPLPNYCAASLTSRLQASGHRTWWKGGPGQGFVSWIDVTRERATARPSKFILAMGTNDVTRHAKAPEAQREDERWKTIGATYASVDAIRAANPNACIVLTTVAGKPANVPNWQDEAALLNTFLNSVAANPAVGNLQIANFAGAVQTACPDWHDSPTETCTLFSPDGIHLTGQGNDARNPLIEQAIARCNP